MKYVLNSTIEWCGKTYRVTNLYQLTPGYMAKHNLCNSNRVTLVNVDDPTDIQDFSI